MRYRITLAIAGALTLVVGCKRAGGDSVGKANRVAELCGTTTNMGAAVCRCIGEKAETELKGETHELLIAMLEKQDQRSAELRAKLPVQEVMKAGMFMVNTPKTCSGVDGTPSATGKTP